MPTTIDQLPALTSSNISDRTKVHIMVDDTQSTAATKQLLLSELDNLWQTDSDSEVVYSPSHGLTSGAAGRPIGWKSDGKPYVYTDTASTELPVAIFVSSQDTDHVIIKPVGDIAEIARTLLPTTMPPAGTNTRRLYYDTSADAYLATAPTDTVTPIKQIYYIGTKEGDANTAICIVLPWIEKEIDYGTIVRIDSSGNKTSYTPTSNTRAARGDILTTAIAALSNNDTLHLWPNADYEGVEFNITETGVTVHGHNATIHRESGVNYDYIFCLSGDGSRVDGLNIDGGGATNTGLGFGLWLNADNLYARNVSVVSTDATGSNGYGIRTNGDNVTVDGFYVYDTTYAGVSHREGDYGHYRNGTIFNCGRGMSIEQTAGDIQCFTLENVKSVATVSGCFGLINFNPTNSISIVRVSQVDVIDQDLVSAGYSYNAANREQCIKFQNIDDLYISDCRFINGANLNASGSAAGIVFDEIVKRTYINNTYMSGNFLATALRLEKFIVTNSTFGGRGLGNAYAAYKLSAEEIVFRNCVLGWESGYGLYLETQTMAYTSGSQGTGSGTPAVSSTITGGTSGAVGILRTISVTSGAFADSNAVGSMTYYVTKGEFQASESVSFSGGQTATGGAITFARSTDRLELVNNRFVYGGTTNTGCLISYGLTCRGNIVCHDNTLVETSTGGLGLSNTTAYNLLLTTDENGNILFDEDSVGSLWYDGDVLAPGTSAPFFSTMPTPYRNGVEIKNLSYYQGGSPTYKQPSWKHIDGAWVGVGNWMHTLSTGTTNPDVTGLTFIRTANSTATTVAKFQNGVAGQILTVFVNDANTTFANDSSSGSGVPIVLAKGSNYAASSGDVLMFVYDGGSYWREVKQTV